MRTASAILALITTLGLHSPAPLFGSAILLISSGDASNDAAIQSVLQVQGNSVTIGPTADTFTGSGLSGYNAVFLNPTNLGLNAPDMPVSGQQALIDFVHAGGGLVAGGSVALLWAYPGDYRTLGVVLPGMPGLADTGNSFITFTSLTSNPLPDSGTRSR